MRTPDKPIQGLEWPLATATVIALSVTLFGASSVNAQDTDNEVDPRAVERAFRKHIVHDMGWRPGTGIKLTTTAFARGHARNYPEIEDEHTKCRSPHKYADAEGLVLFQTEDYDLFVRKEHVNLSREPDSAGELPLASTDFPACLYRRGRPNGEDVGNVDTFDRRNREVVFYEATGAAPPELKTHARGSCGTECGGEVLEIYALDSDVRNPIYQRGFGRNHQRTQPNASYWDLKIVQQPEEPGDPLVFEYHPIILINGVWLPPPSPFDDVELKRPRRPLIRERCVRPEPGKEFDCEKEVIGSYKFDDVKPFLRERWQINARNITYFIEHSDELRERGFIIEPEFIERLKGHLPESMR